MYLPKNRPLIKLVIAFISGISFLSMVSCQSPLTRLLSTPEANSDVVSTVTPTAVATKPPNTAADTITTLPQPDVITLTLWTIERFSYQDELFSQQLANFEQNNPNIKVNVLLKRTSGQASALNFLRVAQPVAPSILPDVVVLSTSDLPQAWRNKLIQPLDGLLDRTIVQDLLPAALKLGTVDDNLAGVPFELDTLHMVYNAGKVITTPVLWNDVIDNVSSYQFPAGGQNGLLNDSLLVQYLSAGAELTDDQGNPIIDEPALLALLNYYQDLLNNGIITPKILNASSPEDLWDGYLAGLVAMVHINAHQYLSDRRLLTNARVAPIPSQNGEVTTVGRGLAFVLVAGDPIRQNAALKLIENFMQTETNAAWAVRSATIPTRQTSFDLVAEEDLYWAFLGDYLQFTQPPPSFAGYDQLSRILLIAIQQVIKGETTPDEAVKMAVQDLN